MRMIRIVSAVLVAALAVGVENTMQRHKNLNDGSSNMTVAQQADPKTGKTTGGGEGGGGGGGGGAGGGSGGAKK